MLDVIYEFLGSISTKLMTVAIICILLGSFCYREYQRDTDFECNGAKFFIERNIELEYDLRKNGQIEDADKLHKSLVGVAKKVDECDFNLLRLLKKRRVK